MKKKNLIVFSLIAVLVIVVVSLFYPFAEESESMGTIGKVDKYRNKNTEQETIVLRNEFLKDTTELKAAINALDSYGIFLVSMQNDLTEWETSLTKAKIKDQKFAKQVSELKQIAAFMGNNLKTVGETRGLLYKYYTKDTLDMSIDIQNNLIQFDNFITNLDEKSKTIDSLFLSLSDMITKNTLEKLTSAKEEIQTLKEVRERMLGTIVFYAYTTGNEARLNLALNSNVLNFVMLNNQLNNKVGLIQSIGMIEIGSRGNLGSISEFINSKQVGAKDQLGTGFTAKDQLGFGFPAKEELGLFAGKEQLGINSKEKLGVHNKEQLGLLGKDGLCVFFSRESLGDLVAPANKEQLGAINSKQINAINNKQLSGLIIANKNLGIIASSNDNYAFAKQQLGLVAAKGAYGLFANSELKNSANWAWAAQNSLGYFVRN